ncbi:unknown [[Mannheimia] succiniciproducens MBEL55E]|uniref:Uncharacterized protein n=1 Tax=Mannheimia succiniciproducens (strain KCTC 0769BP / MBEL55E) TaxID=221988 RepID=Q65R56_MANSM|nr:unknown [[Mannheimia] succiniciproducens MBEL55E]
MGDIYEFTKTITNPAIYFHYGVFCHAVGIFYLFAAIICFGLGSCLFGTNARACLLAPSDFYSEKPIVMANILVKFDNGENRGFIFGSSRLVLSFLTMLVMNLIPHLFLI